MQNEWSEGEWDKPVRVYPPDRLRVDPCIAKLLRESLRRRFSASSPGAYTAAVIMCRKTVEGICVDHGLKTGLTSSGTQVSKRSRVIESRLFEWADELRLFGNDAAHGISITVSQEDARDLLEFMHAPTEYVFAQWRRFEAFKKRTANRKDSVPSSGPLASMELRRDAWAARHLSVVPPRLRGQYRS